MRFIMCWALFFLCPCQCVDAIYGGCTGFLGFENTN